VLAGKTFSSGAGLGATGSMTDNGAVTITPGVADQTIAAGYHNGSGTVAGDADLAAGNIKNGANVFGVVGTLSAGGGVLKTGQTTSYGTGSDGNMQKGTARSFTDNGDGTITDNVTGLMWEKKVDSGGIHDRDNRYTWSTGTNDMDGTIVTTFLAGLNAGGGFAGHTDWRIPNAFELYTLVNLQIPYPGPTVYGAFNSCTAGCSVTSPSCSCTQSDDYWSSSTYQTNPTYVWSVFFHVGHVGTDGKAANYFARAVRAGF